MADNKKYYYLKLKDNFFDSDSMVVLESMQDGYIYSNILLKLYLKSLKDDGRLMLNGRIPYNSSTLAMVTRHSVGNVERAIKAFEELGIVEILDNGAIYMADIQNFIGESSTEADRKRAYRNRIENEKREQLESQDFNAHKAKGQMSGQMADKCPDKSPPEIERERELDLDIETHTERDTRARASKPTLESFDEFWKKYPNKIMQEQAASLWLSIDPDQTLIEEIMQGLDRWLASDQWERGVYQSPVNWLRDKRWLDDPPAAKKSSGNPFLELLEEERTQGEMLF